MINAVKSWGYQLQNIKPGKIAGCGHDLVDLFYGEDEDGERNEADSVRDSVGVLKRFAADGKPVFVVEYPRNAEQARAAQREIAEQGFVGLVARRDLDRLA